MLERGKISAWQAAIVTLTHPLGTGIFVLPAFAINWAKEDAWLTEVLVTIPALVIVFVVDKLGRMFPGQTIVQYSETILGKYLGKLVGLMMAWYFFYIGTVIIFEMASFLASAVMPETPVVVFIGVTGIAIVFTVYNGVEVIARLNVWFFSIVVVSLILITFLVAKDMNLDNFRPFLANGWKPVFYGSLAPYAWRGTIVIMAMLIPYVSQPQKVKMTYLYGSLILGLLFELNTLNNLAVFGPFEGGRISLPTVELVKMINVAGFIQHIEALLVLVWVGGVFTMSTGWFYASVLGTAQVLNLRDYRPLIIPMMVIYMVVAIINFQSYPEFVDWAQRPWPVFALFHQLLIPVFLLILAVIRGLGATGQGPKQGGNQV